MSIQHSAFSVQDSLIDPRCAWVQVHNAPPGPAWRLVAFKYDDPEESGGNHHIYVHLLDAGGLPAGGIKVTHGWPNHEKPDDKITGKTDPDGNINWAMWENSNIDDRHSRGPYWIQPIEPADWVDGMGLPSKHHVNYRLTFRWSVQVPGEPPIEPGGDRDETVPDLWRAAYVAAKQVLDQSFPFTHAGEVYHALAGAHMGILASRDRDGALFVIFPDEVKTLKGGPS